MNPEDSQQIAVPPANAVSEKPGHQDAVLGTENEDDELCRIAEIAEAASHDMDVDLDELVSKLNIHRS